MFIEIEKKDNKVLLECFPDDFHEPDLHWILDKLDEEDIFISSNCFTFKKDIGIGFVQYISISICIKVSLGKSF